MGYVNFPLLPRIIPYFQSGLQTLPIYRLFALAGQIFVRLGKMTVAENPAEAGFLLSASFADRDCRPGRAPLGKIILASFHNGICKGLVIKTIFIFC